MAIRSTKHLLGNAMRHFGLLLLLATLTLSLGCAKKAVNGPPSVSGEKGKPDSSLAYEHAISVTVAEDGLGDRMSSARAACSDERFGACSLLRFDESTDDYPSGLLVVRIVPAGVEPFVALASEGGKVGSRSTHAEDLAEAVAESALQMEQLKTQRAKLVEFQERKDLAVADMLSLAREIALVESQLTELNRTSTHLQQRIETNLITIRYSTKEESSRWSTVSRSVSESIDSLADGTAEAIELIAYGFPFLLILFPLALVWRKLWRRFTSGHHLPTR